MVQIREAISVHTFSRNVIENPRLQYSTLSSQYQYCAKTAGRGDSAAQGPADCSGSDRPSDNAATGFPGVRYMTLDIRKFAMSRLASSMA
jgi:hypothetical protein